MEAHMLTRYQFTLLLIGSVLMIGLLCACTSSTPPEIGKISIERTSLNVGEEIPLTLTASGVDLKYKWTATGGIFLSPETSPSVLYKAPASPGSVVITVEVSDQGGTAVEYRTLQIVQPATGTPPAIVAVSSPTPLAPSVTPEPTNTPAPTATNTPVPTPTPVTQVIADFKNGNPGWIAITSGTPGYERNETAISVTVSAGALQGNFNFGKTRERWPRGTFFYKFADKPQDWSSFDELQFDAIALPPIQGGVKATIVVRTGAQSCFNEDGGDAFQYISPISITTMSFNLHGSTYKTCNDLGAYKYSLLNPDKVTGLEIVVIPDSDRSTIAGLIQIDNVRLVKKSQ
jgi:hypothetical protein